MKYQIESIGGMKADANSIRECKVVYKTALVMGLTVYSIKRFYKNGLVGDMLPYVRLVTGL